MNRRLQTVAYGVLILGIAMLPLLAQQGAKEGQWRAYASETGSTGYSPLDLINRDNVKNLQVAWSWKFDNFGNTNTEVTPIMVNGVLYFPLSPSRTIIAADAGTGQTLWTYRPPQDDREARAARTYARGVAFWSNGTDERTWLDNAGNPHSDELKVEERYHRVDGNTMELTVVINDPKAYTSSWTARNKLKLTLVPSSTDLMEMIPSASEAAAVKSIYAAEAAGARK